jgi:dihydropteroate synthase
VLWKTARRELQITRPLVMGILNVTPDSFSDGGEFLNVDAAVERASQMVDEGVDIIDIGGESTRPGSLRVSAEEEIARTVPVIEAISKRFDIPISIDTTKFEVAQAALDAGVEIINDISGLRWDERLADLGAKTGAGLVLMHSRGDFDTMHSLGPVQDIFEEVGRDFHRSISAAHAAGVADDQIALDVGIGFGKTFEQNLELIAKLDKLVAEFEKYPMMVGTSRKSFLGRLLGDTPPVARLGGSLATAVLAVRRGAKILRVHDIRATVEALSVAMAVEERSS